LSCRRDVNQRQEDSCYHLHEKNSECGAAEHVPPAGGVSGYTMLDCLAYRCSELQTAVEPFSNFANHDAHGGLSSVKTATADPGVGSSPALILIRPSFTSYGYSNSPRSGGPDAREPSR